MVNQIYPHKLHLNKANTTSTETPFLDLHLSIADESQIYGKRDDFDFDIVNCSFLDGAFPHVFLGTTPKTIFLGTSSNS